VDAVNITQAAGTNSLIDSIAAYDLVNVHKIINEAPVVHVSFTPDPESGFPAILPMIGALGSFEHPSAGIDEPLDCYLHGYVSSRIMNLANKSGESEGLPVCVCATLFDGLVLSLTPNSHSMNYRSAVLHGFATIVTRQSLGAHSCTA
jgi:nitroimidazol reductase NimA-like FMN-containing flavoprotein (pyridoxamine 5'-phosphate oxidase superfamily)